MTDHVLVDPDALREQVRIKYREVAAEPNRTFHFHTGRPLADRLGYDAAAVDPLPDGAVESFAGVGNPFSTRRIGSGERVSMSARVPGSTRSSQQAWSGSAVASSGST